MIVNNHYATIDVYRNENNVINIKLNSIIRQNEKKNKTEFLPQKSITCERYITSTLLHL